SEAVRDNDQIKELEIFRNILGQMIAVGMIEVKDNMPVLKINELISKAMEEQRLSLPDPEEERMKMDNKLTAIQNEFKEQLEKIADPIAERSRTFDQIAAMRKIRKILRNEALELWNSKPESERLIKIGLFRKMEDFQK